MPNSTNPKLTTFSTTSVSWTCIRRPVYTA